MTIDQVDTGLKVTASEFDGKVTYGQKRSNTGTSADLHFEHFPYLWSCGCGSMHTITVTSSCRASRSSDTSTSSTVLIPVSLLISRMHQIFTCPYVGIVPLPIGNCCAKYLLNICFLRWSTGVLNFLAKFTLNSFTRQPLLCTVDCKSWFMYLPLYCFSKNVHVQPADTGRRSGRLGNPSQLYQGPHLP